MSPLFGMIQYVIYWAQIFRRIILCIYSNERQIDIWTYSGVF